MSLVEEAVEKVKHLDEPAARKLLEWLEVQNAAPAKPVQPAGAIAMLGFTSQFHDQPRTTAEWMAEIRAGDRE